MKIVTDSAAELSTEEREAHDITEIGRAHV